MLVMRQLATWVTFSVLDDAAMQALVFLNHGADRDVGSCCGLRAYLLALPSETRRAYTASTMRSECTR